MEYLKKRRMYQVASKLLGEFGYDTGSVSKITRCGYRFYRGIERLDFDNGDKVFVLRSMMSGKWLSLKVYGEDDKIEKNIILYPDHYDKQKKDIYERVTSD